MFQILDSQIRDVLRSGKEQQAFSRVEKALDVWWVSTAWYGGESPD
jgi:hypothetical protein